MGKLFLSLYLYIIVSIFIFSGALDELWPAPKGVSALPIGSELSQTLAFLARSEQGVAHLKKAYKAQALNANQIAFLQPQQEQLIQGQAVPVFESGRQVVWYVNTYTGALLKIGPYHLDPEAYNSVLPFMIMLLVIGVPVGFWSFWLWRDFKRIETACVAINAPEDLDITHKDKSLLLPITTTLMAMKNRIRYLLDTQRELTSSVSHEFRTPLARLKFALAMLEETSSKQVDEVYLRSMHDDIFELESLVNEMLEFAKFERERPNLDLDEINLSSFFESLIKKVSFNTNLSIKVNCTEALSLNADKHFLARAVQNLLSNAVKYASSEIDITAYQCENAILIKVADDGCGIDKKEWDTVFNPFTRVDKSRNKKIKGFGLGLAIVQKIAIWHGGQCYIESSELGGACFVMQIPVT